MKPAETRMRHAPAGAPRRELSKSVEFLKTGSLHQTLWLRDAVWVYRVHCDSATSLLAIAWQPLQVRLPPGHTLV